MKDKKLKLEDIEASHKLGGAGEGSVLVNLRLLQQYIKSTIRTTPHIYMLQRVYRDTLPEVY